MSEVSANKPRWQRDLERFLPLKAQFVLSGNIRDLQAVEMHGSIALVPMTMALEHTLKQADYECVIAYDPVVGFQAISINPEEREADIAFMEAIGLSPNDGIAPAGVELLCQSLQRFIGQEGRRAAIILDFASRISVRLDSLSEDEHRLFTLALVLAQRTAPRPGPGGTSFFNTIFWIVDTETDLPDWLLIENPSLRHIPIAKPDHAIRRSIAPMLLQSISGGPDLVDEQRENALSALVEETEGMLLHDMMSITQLARTEAVPAREIGEAVRRYKVGVTEDPWAKIDRTKIRGGEDFIRSRVKGQQRAVTHILDIVKRAVTAVGASRRGRRPRGVVFLAGPTGVGKTELAKTVTELLFGDESAYIRFDMSEFSAEHADQRLIGAPPGYVGYDAGGELTNAIREHPFSVVLFDEIEKAHPRVLDKFLQVLDDGVLTSGRGDRVYFSEAFIVFTSNLGIYRVDQATGERVPNVSSDDNFETVEERVLEEIERHFKLVLNRPEILNRIGESIIVFDFIREQVAEQIFDAMLGSVLRDVADNGIEISLTPSVEDALKTICIADLSNGGRGIRNKVEANFINPLARALFDADISAGSRCTATSLIPVPVPTLTLELAAETSRPAPIRDD